MIILHFIILFTFNSIIEVHHELLVEEKHRENAAVNSKAVCEVSNPKWARVGPTAEALS